MQDEEFDAVGGLLRSIQKPLSSIGRIFSGTVKVGDQVVIAKRDGSMQPTKITKLYSFDGLRRVEADSALCGEIVALAGVEGIASAAGFGTAETMRRAFLRVVRTSPTEYRNRFRAA